MPKIKSFLGIRAITIYFIAAFSFSATSSAMSSNTQIKPTQTADTNQSTSQNKETPLTNQNQTAPLQQQQSASSSSSTTAQQQLEQEYCPLSSSLVQNDDHTWRSGEGWRGYEQTVATEIDSFVGAQWTGVKIGKIICLYQGKSTFDFPVSLEQKYIPTKGTNLVLEPTGQNWSAKVEGYRFCKSTNVADCPFYRQLTNEPQAGPQLYEQIQYSPIRDNNN